MASSIDSGLFKEFSDQSRRRVQKISRPLLQAGADPMEDPGSSSSHCALVQACLEGDPVSADSRVI